MWAKVLNDVIIDYPYGFIELRRDNPDTSFPTEMSQEALGAWGIVPVEPRNPPDYNYITQNCTRVMPTLENGLWVETWEITAIDAQEAQSRRVEAVAVIESQRKAAYQEEADPLFFMAQRGEATMEEWTAKVAEIKARYPYPVE
jgi:hypothetical protein